MTSPTPVTTPIVDATRTGTASVPAFVVALIEPSFQAWDRVGVTLGNNVEADVVALETECPGLGERAVAYWQRCRDFWDTYADGRTAGHAVRIERRVVQARQSDTKNGRSDLNAHLSVLEGSQLLGALTTEITGANPDWDSLAERHAPLQITLTSSADGTRVQVDVPARQDFPAELGGPHSRGEIARRFTLTVNHAKWRDRRVRRLVTVEVDAVEVWPDPTAW